MSLTPILHLFVLELQDYEKGTYQKMYNKTQNTAV